MTSGRLSSLRRRVTAGSVQGQIRPLIQRDVSGLLTLERAMVADGAGMVREMNDVPRDEAGMRRELSPWLDGPLRPPNGMLLVFASEVPGTVPILGSAELRRLPWAKLKHGAMLAVGVHPEFRGLGLGRALLEVLIAWADAEGLIRLELYVRADNAPARALYERLGFVEEGRRRAFVRLSESELVDDLVMGRVRRKLN